jgi:hypothetical protein
VSWGLGGSDVHFSTFIVLDLSMSFKQRTTFTVAWDFSNQSQVFILKLGHVWKLPDSMTRVGKSALCGRVDRVFDGIPF